LRVWVQVMMRSGTSEKNVRRLNESFMEFHNGMLLGVKQKCGKCSVTWAALH